MDDDIFKSTFSVRISVCGTFNHGYRIFDNPINAYNFLNTEFVLLRSINPSKEDANVEIAIVFEQFFYQRTLTIGDFFSFFRTTESMLVWLYDISAIDYQVGASLTASERKKI